MLKGEIEILVRDAETMEVVDRIVQPNVVVNNAFSVLIGDGINVYIPGQIVAISSVFAPSRNQFIVPGNLEGNTSVVGTAIPGNGNPDWFPENLPTAAFAQWSTRLPLPASNRTISTVMLSDIVSQSVLTNPASSPYSFRAYAYSKLATPCIQTTTQFFDIYYRVFFPTTNQHDMPEWAYANAIRRMVNDSGLQADVVSNDMRVYQANAKSALPPMNVNAGDEEKVWPSWTSLQSVVASALGGTSTTSLSPFFRRKFTDTFALTDAPGSMIGTIYKVTGNNRLTTSYAPVDIGVKIQNLLGHRSTSTAPFLDVSHLQQGTGSISLSGAWDNRGTPSSPGLYATGVFPTMFFVNIVGSGAAAASSYTYSTRPFLGTYWDTARNANNWVGTWRQPINVLPFISQSQVSTNAETNNNIMGDLTKMGVRQLSSWCKYDDTSIVMVWQDQLMVYNIATGDYWTYTGAFTDIRQVTVIGTKIYAACRNTGLYMIDPPNSASVTLITPGGGITSTAAYGCARGFGNKLWVAFVDCIASYDGVSWVKYDSSSVPAFNIAGISDGNWANIEYLVVDEESAADQMLVVRRYDATVNASSLGVWWSTVGTATNAGTETTVNNTNGMPRLNRTHVGGKGGIWLVLSNGRYGRMTFGSATITNQSSPLIPSHTFYQSINFVKNASNVTRWLSMNNSDTLTESADNSTISFFRPTVKLVDAAGTIETSVTSAMGVWTQDVTFLASSGIFTTGNQDMQVSFPLAPGVIFLSTFYTTSNYARQSLRSYIGVYPFDITHAGGALAYLGETSYGWNGSAWDTTVATPKAPLDTSPFLLSDGVSIQFNDDVVTPANSWVNADWYNFVCCEGLQKDSATTASLEYSWYYKRAYKNQTVLDQATVPAATSLTTGIVGLDAARSSSSDVTINGSNQFVFAGANAQQFAVGNKQVTGAFDVTYQAINAPTSRYIAFGLGHAGAGTLLYGFAIVNDSIYVYTTADKIDGIFSTLTSNTLQGAYGLFSASTQLQIRRVGGVIQFLVDGSLKTTVTPPAGIQRFDLISTPYNDWHPVNMIQNRVCPATTIVTNGSDNGIRIGNSGALTGVYNTSFYAIDTDSRNGLTVLLNGVAATAYRVDGTAPAGGEVAVDPYMGILYFNAADTGKTVAATYTYTTHE